MTMALHPSPRARPEMNVVLCIFMMDQFRRPYEIYIIHFSVPAPLCGACVCVCVCVPV